MRRTQKKRKTREGKEMGAGANLDSRQQIQILEHTCFLELSRDGQLKLSRQTEDSEGKTETERWGMRVSSRISYFSIKKIRVI